LALGLGGRDGNAMPPPSRRVKGKRKAKQNGSASKAPNDGTLVLEPAVVPGSPLVPLTISMDQRPFAKLVWDAAQAGQQSLKLPGPDQLVDVDRAPISSSMLIEASPGSLLPPVLDLPGIVIAANKVTLRHICLRSGSSGRQLGEHGHPLIEVRSGQLELIDCRLQGGGIRLRPGTAAILKRTHILQSVQAGISADNAMDLQMEECEIADSAGEGLRVISAKKIRALHCKLSGNALNGALIGGKAGQASFEGCTFSGNGQFGIWVESGCCVLWSKNQLLGNMLGDVSGSGKLDGWKREPAFAAGDACLVWHEQKAVWLTGRVAKVLKDTFVVNAELPVKLDLMTETNTIHRARKKGPETKREVKNVEMNVPGDALRLPKCREEEPPSWSKKLLAYRRKRTAFQLFLQEGGKGAAAWNALSATQRTRFQVRARKENRNKAAHLDVKPKSARAAWKSTSIFSRPKRTL